MHELYLKYLVHCCCHLETGGFVEKSLIGHMVESGKYAYLVVLSNICIFYALCVSLMSRFCRNRLGYGGEISIGSFEIF